jgi:hypothetical protein
MFYVGLDLGQARDPSAVVAVEQVDHRRAFQGTPFEKLVVRFAERMPLGMPYPKVVERVRDIVCCEELWGNCALVVDATGVGAPVVDMIRAARLGCELNAVVITGGERGSGNGSVSKRDLMAEVQLLLENHQLKIGKLREGARLMRELADVRMWHVGGSGQDGGRWGRGARRSGDCDGAGLLAREKESDLWRRYAKIALSLRAVCRRGRESDLPATLRVSTLPATLRVGTLPATLRVTTGRKAIARPMTGSRSTIRCCGRTAGWLNLAGQFVVEYESARRI